MTFDSLNLVLLLVLLATGVWTVMTSDLLRSAIGLALTSAILTLILFQLGGPMAAVFELSVCAGLITVVFISTISLTSPQSPDAAREHKMRRLTRFVFLPLILAVVGWYVGTANIHMDHAASFAAGEDMRQVLWFERRFDLVGQILVILAGVFGVVVLFKATAGPAGRKDDSNGEAKK
jgi:NADH-quinone oxidoreductase subunit J